VPEGRQKEATVARFHALRLYLLGETEDVQEDIQGRLCRRLESNFAIGLPHELTLSL
jgi:hypothetical protein